MRITQFLIGTIMVLATSVALAQTNVATLNYQGVILSSNMAAEFKTQLERELKPRTEALNAMAEEINKMREDGQKNADFLTDEQKIEMAQSFSGKVREYQKMQADLNKEQAEKEQKFIESVNPKFEAVLNEILKSRDIDLLVDSRMVLYVKEDNLDISKDVLDALNAAQ